MKIVILSDDFPPKSFGGAGIIAYNLASKFAQKNNSVTVITAVSDRAHEGVFIEGGMTIHRIYSEYQMRFRSYISLHNNQIIPKLEKILKEIKPDFVHAHNVHTHLSYASLKVAKKYSKMVFTTMHDVMSVHYGKLGAIVDKDGKIVIDSINPLKQLLQYRFYYNPFRNIVIKYYLRYVDKVFVVSSALQDILEKKGIKKISVLHNGIDVSRWSVDQNRVNEFCDRYNIRNKKVLFFGGRLSSAKGGLVAVDVLKEVLSDMSETVLLVAGEKNKFAELMIKKAKNYRIDDKIIFTGWISNDDMKYIYAVSDVVLVLSQYVDPFPTVNLEAMASERPVVGTLFGGTKEAVSDGVSGFIINPVDIELISKKVLSLLKNKTQALMFGKAGRNRVEKLFNEDFWVEKILMCYAEILKNK